MFDFDGALRAPLSPRTGKAHSLRSLVLAVGILAVGAGGASAKKAPPPVVNPTAQRLLEQGYIDAENGKHEFALARYREVLSRYSNDKRMCAWARYEIAFLYYYRHKGRDSLREFTALLSRYDEKAPKILAWKIVKKILLKTPALKKEFPDIGRLLEEPEGGRATTDIAPVPEHRKRRGVDDGRERIDAPDGME